MPRATKRNAPTADRANRGQPVGERPMRADARRNVAAILDAALASLSRDADASIADIARAAGVGRITLYGHFPTRQALVDAVVEHAIGRADSALDAIDVDADPAPIALARLASSSWQILNEHRQLVIAGQHHLGPPRMREHHDKAMERVRQLIVRGQETGHIRTDLPRDWLVTTYYALMHAAADEVNAGRLDPAQAGDVIAATIVSAFAGQPAPGRSRRRRTSIQSG